MRDLLEKKKCASKTANSWKHHIENQQRIVAAQCAIHTLQSIEYRVNTEPFGPQVFRKQFAEFQVIIHDQNSRNRAVL